MFNIGAAELLVVLVIALLVLGPAKLPDAARQVGRALGEMRKLSSGFQAEMRDALKEPVEGKPTASSSSSKAVSTASADDTATGGSLSAPRPPASDATAATPTVAVGDESGPIAPDAGVQAGPEVADAGDVVDTAGAHARTDTKAASDPATKADADALAKVAAADAAHMAAVSGEAVADTGADASAPTGTDTEPAGVKPEPQAGPRGTTAT